VTKTTSNSQSTTFEWLLNILKNSKEFAQARVYLWRDLRSFAIKMKGLEAPYGSQSYDKSEYDGWVERIRLNDQFEVNTELLGRLIIKVEDNPYPGEQKRVLKLAMDLIPEGGKGGWCAIFRDSDFDFPPNFENERISFPAEVSVDVKVIEGKLWELVREDNTIAADAVAPALGFKANSKAYRTIKSKLQERNWIWANRREEGKMTKIVIAPERN
jgi:hypothetical protein